MIIPAIRIVALVSVLACCAVAIFLGANGIRSVEDFRNYRVMRSLRDPIVVALANGSLTAGSTTNQMFAVDTPLWTEDYGRCKIYGFTPEQSYDYQTIVTVDDRMVSARVGSCTWRWTFFDAMPEDVAESVWSVRALRDTIEQMPDYAVILQPQIDQQLAALGVPPTATAEMAEPSDAPMDRASCLGNGESTTGPR